MPKVNKAYVSLLKNELEKYLSSNRWEAENRDLNFIPHLHEYSEKRPFFSGGNLAIALIPLGLNYPYAEIQRTFEDLIEVKQQASTLIYLTNDLISFEKEKELDDFHNLVVLLMHHKKFSKEQAKTAVFDLHGSIVKKFSHQGNSIDLGNFIAKEIHLQLKYQVAGAVAWSLEDTNRYNSVYKSINL